MPTSAEWAALGHPRVVLVRCTCDHGKIGFGRYCPDCGGLGSVYVPEFSREALNRERVTEGGPC